MPRKIIPVMLVFLVSVCASSAIAQPKHDPNSVMSGMASLFSPGVVGVEVKREGGESTKLAGFFTGPGKLVTVRSAVSGATGVTVTFDNGKQFEVVRVVAEDPKADLVTLTVEVPPQLRRGLRLSRSDALFGERLLLIGPPIGKNGDEAIHTQIEADMSGYVKGDGPSTFRFAADTDDSLLGSPLINVTGQAVGVLSTLIDEKTSRRLIVSASEVLNLEDAPGLTLAEWNAGGSIADTRVTATDPATGELVRPKGFPPPRPEVNGHPVAPARIEQAADDALRFDGRFMVYGEGTKESPYLVSWDQLLSAQEDYVPRKKKTALPERVAFFDGKHVEVTGFISFPLQVTSPTELLVALNQWDGCCIGVPPTPYDAAEVSLTEPVKGTAKFATYGTINGVLRVDPYLVGEWLVGLYVFDHASFKPAEFGGFDNE